MVFPFKNFIKMISVCETERHGNLCNAHRRVQQIFYGLFHAEGHTVIEESESGIFFCDIVQVYAGVIHEFRESGAGNPSIGFRHQVSNLVKNRIFCLGADLDGRCRIKIRV